MMTQTILAVLTDPAGEFLLVRRRESSLWSLPGGVLRALVSSRSGFLAACCHRQVGVRPDFVGPLREFEFAGQPVAVGVDEISAERAHACGRVETSRWFRADELPDDIAPLARLAIEVQREAAESRPALVSA